MTLDQATTEFNSAADIVFGGQFANNLESSGVLTQLVGYFSGNDTALDKSKGIVLVGARGTGKTTLLTLFQYLVHGSRDFAFGSQSLDDVESAYRTTGLMPWEARHKVQSCMWDDIGIEKQSSRYGQKKQVGEDVIMKTYQWWCNLGIRSHFTTNIAPADFNLIYDDRAADRLLQMSNIIPLPSIDFRDITGVRPDFDSLGYSGPGFFKQAPGEAEFRETQRAGWIEQSEKENLAGRQTRSDQFNAMWADHINAIKNR